MNYQQKIKQSFDSGSASYEKYSSIQEKVGNQLLNYMLSQHIPKNNKNILDIGTGTGFMATQLLQNFPNANYLLNDLSSGMLNLVKKKFSGYDNIKTLLGDAEEINFDQHDMIVSNLAFQWFQNLYTTLPKLWLNTNILAFSTLLDGTFSSLQKLYDNAGLFSGLQLFSTEHEYRELCLNLNPKHYFFATKDYYIDFRNPLAFIKYLKNLGAHTPKVGYQHNNGLALRKILKLNTEIQGNYKVFFAILIK